VATFVRRSSARALLITNSEVGYAAIPKIREAHPNLVVVDVLHTIGTPDQNDAFLRVRMPYRAHIHKAVTVSDFLRQYMLDQGYADDPQRITVIPNATPPFFGRPSLEHRADAHRILWLGRIDRDKDPLAVVEVAQALALLEPSNAVSISMAGDGELMNDLIAELDTADGARITALGYVSDVESLLASHDVLLNTSPLEGQPLAVLEALAADMTVVAYRTGGFPEMAALDDRITLVPLDAGPTGLATALLEAFRQTRATTAASQHTDQEATWRGHVDAYLGVLGLDRPVPAERAP
jgi:glycosyltransferase involved in cell wall biosynthesis